MSEVKVMSDWNISVLLHIRNVVTLHTELFISISMPSDWAEAGAGGLQCIRPISRPIMQAKIVGLHMWATTKQHKQ
jgi:hypothetical protein